MAKVAPLITSVNSGEFSPRMAARVDFDRYRNACTRARNVVLLPTGGFTKCPGTRYVTGTLDETKVGRLLEFKFSSSDAYVIEMGENQARFYRRQAKITCPDVGAAILGGDFDVTGDISYWDVTGTGLIVYDETGERLQLGEGNDEQYSSTEQAVTTSTTGVEHVIRFRIEGATGAKVKVVVGSTADSDDLFAETELGVGWHTVAFTPSSSPFYFGVRNYTDETIYLDDVALLDNTDLVLTHDYSESEIQDIRTVQTADVLYLFHPTKPTRKFERRANRTWSLVEVAWEDGPYNEPNESFDFSLTQLVQNPLFEDGIRYWNDESGAGGEVEWDGAQRIVNLTSDQAEPAIEQPVATGANGSNVFVFHFQVLGSSASGEQAQVQIGSTSDGTDVLANAEYEQGWHSLKITSSASTFYIRFLRPAISNESVIIGVGGALLYRQNSRLLELSGTEGDVTCTAYGHSPFAATDVGRIIRFTWPGKEPAWGIITGFTSATSVSVRLRREAPYADIPTEDWQLGSWSETNGYPSNATFFQSRLVAANTTRKPQTLWFTQTGDLENMRPDSFKDGAIATEDDDALTYLIAAEEVNGISWMSGQRKLLIGTSGGAFVAESQGAAITATDISVTRHADVSCKDAKAIFTESSVVFIEQSGRQVHDLGYNFDQDSFLNADLTILADHILRSPAEEVALQKRPFTTVWTRKEDGRLAMLAYNRRQEIVGWSQRILGGVFGASGDPVVESIAVIPGSDDNTQVIESGNRDEVWLMVKRTIDGSTVRYIEFFETFYEGVVREDYTTEALWEEAVKTHMQDAFYVDCGYTYEGTATDTITGLDHLEGQTVAVLANGRVHSNETVASGSITLDYEVTKAQIGLPYKWSFETLKQPFGTQSGSGLGKQKTITACTYALLDAGKFTTGVVIYDKLEGRRVHQTEETDFNRSGLDADEPIPLFTGEYRFEFNNAPYPDHRIYMEDTGPLPFTCLAIAPEMSGRERG